MSAPKTQLPVEIPQFEVIEIDDDVVTVQGTDVVEVEPCPNPPTVKTPLKISYKAGCASVLSKLHYPDYYPDFDLVEFAVELIRRSGYRIVRRYDRGSHIIIEFARP